MGDELGRSQHGNNNAYCQDNELSWVDWPSLTAEDRAFAELVGRLVELRRTHPLLRQARYLHGEPTDAGLANVTWLAPEGRAMTPADWHDPHRRCFGLMLAGEGGLLAVLLNADERPQRFALPRHGGSAGWRILLDTADPTAAGLPPTLCRWRPGAWSCFRSPRLSRAAEPDRPRARCPRPARRRRRPPSRHGRG